MLVSALLLTPAAAVTVTVTVKGSDTMVILVQRWAEELMRQRPELKIQVTGGGSGPGLAALVNGTTDIASSSRPIKDPERNKVPSRYGAPPIEIAVAKDGVAFCVNAANPLGAPRVAQLRAIYLGDVTNWRELGGPDARIIVYSRESSSGTYVFVEDQLLAGIPSVVLGLFALMVLATLFQDAFTVSEGALRAVPESYREASLALGATP